MQSDFSCIWMVVLTKNTSTIGLLIVMIVIIFMVLVVANIYFSFTVC